MTAPYFIDGVGKAYKSTRAHRTVFILATGVVPKLGEMLLHSCDNPSCVNPDHLRIGSHLENSRDMCERGRSPRGEVRPNSKLTVEAIAQIRETAATQPTTCSKLARQFGVSRSLISHVTLGRGWTHVKSGPTGSRWSTRKPKLSREIADQIRAQFRAGVSRKELAARYGVTYPSIFNIIAKKVYR